MSRHVLVALALAAPACIDEPGPPPCAPLHYLDELNPPDDSESPWLSADRTEIFFNAKTGGFGLYQAVRSGPSGAFQPATVIKDDSSGNDDFDASLSDDGKTLWYVNGSGNGGGYIQEATRASKADPFTGDRPVFASLTVTFGLLHPTFTRDKLQVFFTQNQGTDFDIYTATRASESDDFGSITAVAGVNSPFDDMGPTISADGSILYFDSPRFADAAEQASPTPTSHIGFATRASGFTDPQPVTSFAAVEGHEDSSPWISPDGATIVFGSTRPGGPMTGHGLWIACE